MRQLTLCVRDQRHLSRPARRLFETLRQAA